MGTYEVLIEAEKELDPSEVNDAIEQGLSQMDIDWDRIEVGLKEE